MRGWIGTLVLAGGLALADWGAGQGVAVWARRALAGAEAAGQGGAEAVVAAGFPTRFGVSLEGPWGADADLRPLWALKQARITAPVWAPLSWQVDLPLPQQVALRGRRFDLTGKTAGARLDLAAGRNLPVRGLDLQMQDPALTWEAAAAPSLAARSVTITAQSAEGMGDYHVSGQLAGLAFPPGLAAALSRQAPLPDRIDSVTLRATVTFDRPFALIAEAPAVLVALDLAQLELIWGGHRIRVSGHLTVAPDGIPEGTLTIALSDFPVWLDFALSAGLVPPERKAMLLAMGDYLARQSPDGSVQLPLSFDKGWISLAAIPLGPAPQLR